MGPKMIEKGPRVYVNKFPVVETSDILNINVKLEHGYLINKTKLLIF